MGRREHVVIVGGGLIGLSAAYALLRDGHRVTIVERERLGAGAATGNAGELTPQQIVPLASRGILGDIARGLFSRSDYLSIEPRALPRLARFGLNFVRGGGKRRAERGIAALAQFSSAVLPALWRMRDDGIDVAGGGHGYLMTSANATEVQAAHQRFTARAERGWGDAPGPILHGEALLAAEPVLQPSVTNGFMLPGELSIDPVRFVQSLGDYVQTQGAQVRTGLTALRLGDGASVLCKTDDGNQIVVRGDRVVIAAGAWTSPILRASRIPSPVIVSGKGYSFTVPVERMPTTLLYSMDRHCVAIPMSGRLRIVGMMEFDGKPEQFNSDRIDVLVRNARRFIRGAEWDARSDEWMGARPMTSDGLPLLGGVPGRPEVIVASGHNMHGLSLGPVTGEVVASLVSGVPLILNGERIDLAPFSVGRRA